jgi:hypothetical protein
MDSLLCAKAYANKVRLRQQKFEQKLDLVADGRGPEDVRGQKANEGTALALPSGSA